jgi:serine protease Do
MSDDVILDMIEAVVKGVVNVNALHVIRDYFNRRIPLQGIGSGWVYDRKMIITNAHVVADADRIGVTLHDGTLVEGRVRGIYRSIDTAVVDVDYELTPLEKGDSSNLRVGQDVYAIGNPFGLKGGPTMTRGVVSALNRTIKDDTTSL